ncbi:hypothetical protein [Streptomyces globisporus]|uniref:hypothetical protein n=1 Tax=Streptomyces globisporus TaxID=1908 RepID=UPI0036AE7EA3
MRSAARFPRTPPTPRFPRARLCCWPHSGSAARRPGAARRPAAPDRSPPGAALPILIVAAFLLPPAAAALVAASGSLAGRVEQPPYAARRIWRAAQLALTCAAASWAHAALGRPATLGGGGAAPDLPRPPVPRARSAAPVSGPSRDRGR